MSRCAVLLLVLTPLIARAHADGDDYALDGPLYYLGDFDACVFQRQQQYCYSEVNIWPLNHSSIFWQQIQASNSVATHFRRDVLYRAVCVDLDASASDAQTRLLALMSPSADELGVQARVLPPHCATSAGRPWRTADILAGCVLGTLILLVLTATVMERFSASSEVRRKPVARMLMCFSAKRSLHSLTVMDEKDADLRGLQGIRMMAMTSFLFCNYWLIAIRGPVTNYESLERAYSSVGSMFVLQSYMLVYAVFSISGMIACYKLTEHMNRRNGFSTRVLVDTFLNRYLRLTPSYAVTILLTLSLLPRLATGPTWFSTVDSLQHNCDKQWWINLLYLNNIVGVDETCLLHTWYLAADFQLFCACSCLVACACAYPRSAKYVLTAGVVLGVAAPFAHTLLNDAINPTLLATPETMRHLTHDVTYQLGYITPHYNLGPYMIGVVLAYTYTHIKLNNVKLSKVVLVLLWLAAAALPLVSMIDAYGFYQPHSTPSRWSAAVYSGLNSNLMAAGMSAAILLAALGHGGRLNQLGTSRPVVYLSRLSYCFYLVHYLQLSADIGRSRRPIDLDKYEVGMRSIACVLVNIKLAAALYVLVEAPCEALRRLLFTGRYTDHQDDALHSECRQDDTATSNI